RVLVDGDPPEVHDAAAVAREVEVASVRRPDRVPVDGRILRDGDRVTAGGGHRPYVALARGEASPVRDPVTVRRPLRLRRVAAALRHQPALLARRDLHDPDLASAPPPFRARDPRAREGDLLSLRPPGGMATELREPPPGLA